MKKLLTVIVPIYNAESKIRRCVNSICNQTYNNLEIILVDDGSTDNSVEICKMLESSDERIKLICQKNSGPGSARNAGLSISTGSLITFVDADDFIDITMYEKMVEEQSKYDSDIIICGAIEQYENKKRKKGFLPEECHLYHKEQYIQLFEKYKVDILVGAVWNKIYKKELLHDVWMAADTTYAEDLMFNIDLARKAESIYIIKECLYRYCRDGDNSLSRKPKDIKDYITKVERTCLYYKNIFKENVWERAVLDFYEYELFSVYIIIFTSDLRSEEKINYFLDIKKLKIFRELEKKECIKLETKLIRREAWKLLFIVGIKYKIKQKVKKLLKNRSR